MCSTRTVQIVFLGTALLVFYRDCSASVLQAGLSLCSLGELNLCSERVRPTCVLQGVLRLCSQECSACVLQGLLSLFSQVVLCLCSKGTAHLVFYRDCSACVLWESSTYVVKGYALLVFYREC